METSSAVTDDIVPRLRKKQVKVTMDAKARDQYLKDLMKRHRFWVAVSKQNEVANTAIKSLDCLNDQIVQYIVSGQNSPVPDALSADDNDDVRASMVLIRRLLLDAQSRFRRMVEDNRQLASHIDDSIQAANQEVNLLKAELASTSKRLSQMSMQDIMGKSEVGTQVEADLMQGGIDTANNADQTVESLSRANKQLMDDYKELLENHDVIKVTNAELKAENEKVQAENLRLEREIATLQREYEEVKQIKMESDGNGTVKPSYGELKLELIQTRQELNRAKEVLQGLKSDRKRLKGEKLDLLSQMKQLYSTLEEKETELRDFIRNYEQRVKESDDMIKQVDMLAKEKEETDHEKWEIITKARDAAERAVFFRAQLDNREQQVKSLETELAETKRILITLGHSMPSPTLAMSSSLESSNNDNDNNNFLLCSTDTYSISSTGEDTCLLNFNTSVSSTPIMGEQEIIACNLASSTALAISTPILPSPRDSALGSIGSESTLGQSQDEGGKVNSIGSSNTNSSSNINNNSSSNNNGTEGIKKKKKSFHGLSRMFKSSRIRRSVTLSKGDSANHDEMPVTCAKLSVLNQDNYQEKLGTVEHMQGLDMREWRAHQVLAWLEITLAMPMYAVSCLHNIKSGKVLLGLSDSELSSALSVSNHIHRRKLRLSIEQHRNPNEIKYPKANEMDPTWIAHRFLPDLGLPQYTAIFEEQLCDGHVINTLTRKDLEKYFSVHRKFHQSSIMHAVELLRRICFNKEKLYKRRTACEEADTDMIVWTNERLLKWIQSIDLGEYSENLKESGLHGAVMVLEPSFCSDMLSSVLGIPPSKSYIRRHLTEELDTILKPARVALDSPEIKNSPDEAAISKERKLTRGRHSSSHEEGRSRLSFRGSLGKAFGKKVKDDLKLGHDSTGGSSSSKKKISAPIPIQHSSLSSLENNAELLKKGFCLPDPKTGVKAYPINPIDLQRSLSATGALNKPPTAAASNKSVGRGVVHSSEERLKVGDESAAAPKRTLVDMVKGMKSDANTNSANTNVGSTSSVSSSTGGSSVDFKTTKAKEAASSANRSGSSKNDRLPASASMTSSSSQDTLTEQSAVAPILSRTSSREGNEHDHSQTESVSQSSSTESALEVKAAASASSSVISPAAAVPSSSSSSSSSKTKVAGSSMTSPSTSRPPLRRSDITELGGRRSLEEDRSRKAMGGGSVKAEAGKLSGKNSVKRAASLIESSLSQSTSV